MQTSNKHLVIPNFTRVERAYFEDVMQPVFQSVAASTEPIKKTYLIAGKQVCLLFYHKPLLEKLSRALSHLEIQSDAPAELTVHLWDSVSSGTSLSSPFDHADHTAETETQTQKEMTDAFLGIFLSGEQTLNVYDLSTQTAYFWTRDASLLPDWLSAAPIRPILHWFLSRSNIHLMHGAVVGLNGRAVLLSAKGGSGKSTTAISSILAGMDYLGDDYVAISADAPITAHSLYQSAKVSEETMRQFPVLAEHIFNPTHKPEDKSIVFLGDVFPERIKTQATLAAIIIPHIVKNGTTRLRPATKLEAMLALTPTHPLPTPISRRSPTRRI